MRLAVVARAAVPTQGVVEGVLVAATPVAVAAALRVTAKGLSLRGLPITLTSYLKL
jgi:hypothetical protein